MYDAAPEQMQRSAGAAFVRFACDAGRTRLADLSQQGSAKAMLPRVFSGPPEVVFLNTSGGLTSGDRLSLRLALDADARAIATTQTAERAYAAPQGPARVEIAITAGTGAEVDWVPQETILFQGADLIRSTRIELAADARCVFAETVVLGRAAMGETLHSLKFRDDRMILRAGRPVLAEPVVIGDALLTGAERPALLCGARAFATLALLERGAEDLVAAIRPDLVQDGVVAAVSGWDGKCVIRLMAADAWPLRRLMGRLLPRVTGRALPRVWQI